MNPDQLRETYNKYFSSQENKWSSTNPVLTMRVAKQVLKWSKELGLTRKNLTLLDVGCGTGYFTNAFTDLGLKSTGLDYSDIAIAKASKAFPNSQFIHMNGFEPNLHDQYDIIFCRGFSGANTHDLDFIAGWVNRYVKFLSKDGFFVLAYSTDFSGVEKSGETVNHSRDELNELMKKINAKYKGLKIFSYLNWISKLKRWVYAVLLNRQQKVYYYLFLSP